MQLQNTYMQHYDAKECKLDVTRHSRNYFPQRDVRPGVIAAVTAGFKAFVVVVPTRRRLCRKEEFLANIFKDWKVGARGELAQLEALLLRVHPDQQDDLITLIG